jgi:hypothetical protein
VGSSVLYALIVACVKRIAGDIGVQVSLGTLSLRFDVLLCYKNIVYLHLAIELILRQERRPAIPSPTQREHYTIACS